MNCAVVDDEISNSKVVCERLQQILLRDDYADIYFLVGTNEVRFPGHKLVMALGSPVFNAMFYGPLATKNLEIQIPDCEPKAFKNLMTYLYTASVNLNIDDVLDTLIAADKYQVKPLVEAAAQFAADLIDVENCLELWILSRMLNCIELESKCIKKIEMNASEVFATNSFTNLRHEELCILLKQDSLNIDEADLLKEVLRWAEVNCQRNHTEHNQNCAKEVLSFALDFIRFPLIKNTELKRYKTLTKCSKVKPRKRVAELKIERPGETVVKEEYPWARSRYLTFKTDQAISLTGIGLMGENLETETQVLVSILEMQSNQVILQENSFISSDASDNIFPITFESPVFLNANTFYQIEAYYYSDCCYHISSPSFEEMKTLRVGNANINITFAQKFVQSIATGIINLSTTCPSEIPELCFRVNYSS